MNSESKARLVLLNSIESGSIFWSQEVSKKGAEQVVEGIKDGSYDFEKEAIGKIKSRISQVNLKEVINQIKKSGALFIDPQHEFWPKQLNDLANPPFGLILKGAIENILLADRSIAVVGTRNPTNYGMRIASDFAAAFAEQEWIVVSGGALGIDSCAHRGALVVEGLTIGILAGGVNNAYPQSNFRLFEEIGSKGILISEVMPDVHPIPVRFLIRNRLIAALTKGTLVVEAAYRSGSLRTARDAAELLRPVMAIPGPINNPNSEGCNKLISERCAELVSSVTDVLELVSPLA